MALIIERGVGLIGANAYVDAAFVTAYLTERGRETENGWGALSSTVKDNNVLNGTDYIEYRWGPLFRAGKQYLSLTCARGSLYLTQQPVATETVVIGSITYTFQTTLSSANDVLIGASISVSIDNLIAAITAAAGEGTLYGTGTVANTDAEASTADNNVMLAEAVLTGTPGNEVVTTTTVTNAEWSAATLIGGSDQGTAQTLSFPRLGLVTRDGSVVTGVPVKVLQANAEYAVRAAGAILTPDPTNQLAAGAVISTKEVVGPIVDETTYAEGESIRRLLQDYPAADKLLSEFISSGGVIRA